MNRFNHFAAAAAIAVVLPAIAFAQAQPAPDQSAPAPDQANMAPSAGVSAVDSSAGPVAGSTGPVSADQLPSGQAQALATGDNKMVTNGPVPDTRANRAKYGPPMSHAGKKTPPVGN